MPATRATCDKRQNNVFPCRWTPQAVRRAAVRFVSLSSFLWAQPLQSRHGADSGGWVSQRDARTWDRRVETTVGVTAIDTDAVLSLSGFIVAEQKSG